MSIKAWRTHWNAIFLIPRCFFRMWGTFICANPNSRTNSQIVWCQSVFSNVETACTSSSLTRGWPGRGMSVTFYVPRWRLLPTLQLFYKAVQISRKSLEDFHDTVVCTDSDTFNLYPTLLFLFQKHCDNSWDCQLSWNSICVVTAHAHVKSRRAHAI